MVAYYIFNIKNKFNILTFPKHGCTQIIKIVSEINNIFHLHNHSYNTNDCSVYGTIHNCGQNNKTYNANLPTYLITRKIEDKILSYYLSNYTPDIFITNYLKLDKKYFNMTFNEFVNNINYFQYKDAHLQFIKPINKLLNIKNLKLLDLSNLDNELKKIFIKYNIKFDYKKERHVINNSKRHFATKNILLTNPTISNLQYFNIKRCDLTHPPKYKFINKNLFFNDSIIKQIKNHYKNDLEYFLS